MGIRPRWSVGSGFGRTAACQRLPERPWRRLCHPAPGRGPTQQRGAPHSAPAPRSPCINLRWSARRFVDPMEAEDTRGLEVAPCVDVPMLRERSPSNAGSWDAPDRRVVRILLCQCPRRRATPTRDTDRHRDDRDGGGRLSRSLITKEPTTIAVKNRIRCMRSRTAGTSWTAS